MKRIFITLLALFMVVTINAYQIYPKPQSITTNGGEITIQNRMNVVIEEGVNENVKTFITEALEAKGIKPVFKRYVSTLKYLYVGVNGSGGDADSYATSCGLSRSVFSSGNNKFDPYLLHIANDGTMVILGDNNNSVFYGVSTLSQMLNSNYTITPATVQDYSYTQYRGLVEGFYGMPFTVDQILSMLDFFKKYKLNTFIYGPKADPYHAGSWDEDYPISLTDAERKKGLLTQDDFRTITAKAKECNVNFVWAIHPGLHGGMSFDSKSAMNPGIEKIMDKFDRMYNLGVRGFGVFIDDMSFVPSAEMTAYLPAQVQAKLKAKYNTSTATAEEKVSPLFFVPTAYSIAHTTSSLTQLASIDKDVVIAFTGDNVWSNISASSCNTMKSVLGRNPLFWWNNNCNDNYDDRLYMGHMNYRYSAQNAPITALGGVVFNPMQEASASKVFMFGGADYCWNTASFNSEQNWNDCFSYLFPNNPELAAAFKTFCINVDATQEPYEMISLYASFKDSYSNNSMPSSTSQLISKTKEIYDACMKVEEMKTSEIEDEQLMYEDIKCWNGKLASMTNIINKALSWMKSPGTLTDWITYANVSGEYSKLHKDSAYIAYTVEGTGTEASPRYFEVHPAQQSMEPFVDYLMTLYPEYAPTLPQRNRTAEIVHNLLSLPSGVTLSSSSSAITLQNLSNVSLGSGDYVGINMNKKNEVTVSVSSNALPSEFFYEYSINGKEWFNFTPDGTTPIELAYVRVRNVSREVTKPIGVSSLTINIPKSGILTPVNVETNIPQYGNNAVSNVINYSNDHYFWSSRAQQAGDYIRVDLGASKSVYKVEITFDSNDQPSGDCAIQISTNGSLWQNLATFTNADITDKAFSVTESSVARYVQFKLNSAVGNNWMKVIKIKVYEGKEIAVAYDNNGTYSAALDDRSLATSYQAMNAGWLEYEFTENLNFETIEIYHNSKYEDTNEELPTISIKADGEWHDMGYLNNPLTELDVRGLKNISIMKFEWNSVNRPDIYDIVVNGTPFVGDHDITGVEEWEATAEEKIYFEGDNLTLSGVTGMVTVCNAAGVVIMQGVATDNIEISLPTKGVYIVTTQKGSYKVIRN